MEFEQFIQVINAGGNTALLAACYFIWRASGRLSRIEAMLELVLRIRGVDIDKIEGKDHE